MSNAAGTEPQSLKSMTSKLTTSRLSLFLLLAALLYVFNLPLANWVSGGVGLSASGEEHTLGRVLLAMALAGLVWANIAFLRSLPQTAQVYATWIESFALFALLLLSFNLSLEYILSKLLLLLSGVGMTLYISAVSITFASIVALALALARLSSSGILIGLSGFYISFFRGTPLLLQVYIIYVGLPQLGLILPAVPSAIIALVCNYSAYMSEIFRAGILAIPAGQIEAGWALGLSPRLITQKIVLPQALRMVVPPVGNMFIAMLEDSSLVSILGVWELMFIAKSAGRTDFRHFDMLMTAAMIYWVLSFVLELLQRQLEIRLSESLVVPSKAKI